MATSTNPWLIIGACLSTSLGDKLAEELVEGRKLNANYLANALREEGQYCNVSPLGKTQVIDTSLGEWRVSKGEITEVPHSLRKHTDLLQPIDLPSPTPAPF